MKSRSAASAVISAMLVVAACLNVVQVIVLASDLGGFEKAAFPLQIAFLASIALLGAHCALLAFYNFHGAIYKARLVSRVLATLIIIALPIHVLIGDLSEFEIVLVVQFVLTVAYQMENDPNLKEAPSEDSKEFFLKKRVPLSFYNLFWIFMIGCVVGLVMETIVATIQDGHYGDRAGLLWGPFSPIYGFGAVLMTVAVDRIWNKNPFIIFLITALIGASFEFIVGWFWESAFGIVAWSYADQPFNLGGHTSLELAIVWGILGLAWAKFLLPGSMKLIGLIPKRFCISITLVVLIFMIVNGAMTLMSFDSWFQRKSGQPVSNETQEFFAEHFNDEFMESRFQTMSMYTDLSTRNE